nr:hypothetical protein [Tanacetum cinerariifolium]
MGTLQEKGGRATSFFPPTVVVRGTTLNDKTSSDVAYIMLDSLVSLAAWKHPVLPHSETRKRRSHIQPSLCPGNGIIPGREHDGDRLLTNFCINKLGVVTIVTGDVALTFPDDMSPGKSLAMFDQNVDQIRCRIYCGVFPAKARNTMKEIATNFGKLNKFEGHDFRQWQNKMHFLLTTLKMVYVLTTPMLELLENATVEALPIRAKWENDDYICRGHILNGMSDSLFDVYTNVESAKELWDPNNMSLVQLGSHLHIEESLRAQDSDKGKDKEVGGPTVNITEKGDKNKHHRQNKGKKRSNENNSGSSSTRNQSWNVRSVVRLVTSKGIAEVVKRTTQMLVVREKVDAIAWWIDFGATTHVCKDRSEFKTYEPVEDGFVLYMGDDHFANVYGKGSMALEFSFGKTITLFNVLYVPNILKNLVSGPMLNKCGYKQVFESDKYILSKLGVFVGFGYYNNVMFMLNLNKVPDDSDSVYMSSSIVVNSLLWHACLGHVHYKRMLEMSKDDLIPAIDEDTEKCTTYDASRFCCVYLLHAKDEALDKFKMYKTEVELQQNDLIKTIRTDRGGEYYDHVFLQSVGIIHETKAPYTPQQNGVAKRKNKALKEMANSMLSFYIIEPNDSVSINSIIESRDAIFDENRFSSIPRPNDSIPNSDESQRDDLSDDVPNEIKPRKGKRVRKAKSCGSDFQLYLVKGSRDQVELQYSYSYSIKEDPRTYNEAMQSQDYAFWKEENDDEIGSIMKNNTWVLSDLPPRCKPLGCKWIFTSDPSNGCQINILNGDLEEEVYMKKPEGFVMSGNDVIDQNQDDKTKKFLSSRFLMKDIGEANIILDCSPVCTPMDPVEKLKLNTGKPVDQLKYSRAIGCFMYAMTSTRPDIAYTVGRLSRFTSNPSRHHWKAITRVFKYLRGTKDYGLSYVGYLSVLEGYSNASCINHVEDSSFTSGWMFLLGGGAISWASKKQTCIIGSTIAPTMAKANSQIYNGKSRHLGVRHSMVRELIKNGVIFIEFV